jgi:hypothetical protein
MSAQDQPIQDLLQRRLALVGTISALTARTHKLIQENSGAEMEILRLKLALGRSPADRELLRALEEAEDQAETIRSNQDDCIAQIEAGETALMEIDRLIEGAKGEQS